MNQPIICLRLKVLTRNKLYRKMYLQLYYCTCFFTSLCLLLWGIRTISCVECNTMKIMFVNTSDSATFKIDRYDMGSIIDRLFPNYFELHRLKPRHVILHMSKSGNIEYLDRSYANRTEVRDERTVMYIVIHDIRKNDGDVYTVEVPRTSVDICFTVYVLGPPTKPKIAALPSPQSVEEETSLNLSCFSSSTTYPPDHNLKLTYFWEINGKPLLSNESNERFHVNGAFLKIVSIDRSDRDKRFTCRVNEENGLSRFSTFSPNVTWGPKLILELKPPDTVYLLKAGDMVPVITCKTDCSPDCDILWRKVAVNSSLTYSHEYILDLGPFAVEKAGEYICVARRQGTNEVGVRAVTFKMEDKTDALKQNKVTTIGSILGALLFLSMVAIAILFRILHLERLRRTKDKRMMVSALNGTMQPSTDTIDKNYTYEELDEKPRNQYTYEDVKKDPEHNYTNSPDQSKIYENRP